MVVRIQPSLPYRNARKRPEPKPPLRTRRLLHVLFMLVTAVLMVNGLVGERGLMESLEAGRQHRWLQTEIERLRHHNDRLRRQARRLREDPAAIEAVARRDLGLIRPGELVFLLNDTPSTDRAHRAGVR